MISSKDDQLWSAIVGRIMINTISYPIEYAKVLMQIGHEPMPPYPTVTFLRSPALGLPNIFQYVRYIKKVDGFTGCYRGLVPKLCAFTISAVACEKTSENITFEDEPDIQVDEDDLSDEDRRKRYLYDFIRDLISKTVGIIASHPFEVITIRTMAQFVGGETKYNGVIRSIVEVYREDGIMGYYSGIVPRLIANVAALILASSTTYILNKYVVPERDMKAYTASTVTFLSTAITYPFLVVSHCMAVNNCGLTAGMPPNMPIYNNWLSCWSDLACKKQLARGSSLLWRYAPKTGKNNKDVNLLNEDNYYIRKNL